MRFKRIITALMAVYLTLGSISFGEALSQGTSALLGIDFETGDISYQYKIDERVAIASTTKLMTYLVVMDEISDSKSHSLEDRIVIDRETSEIGGSTFELEEGEILTVEELLNALLIVSGNDACYALAKHFAGDEYRFVEKMNYKASELGLESAVFYTSSGLPDKEGRNNLMTSRDLYELVVHIIDRYPEILDITSREVLSYQDRQYSELNTNPLIGKIPGVDGLKTGFTNMAGRCLVATGVQDDGNRVVAIVMGTADEEARAQKSAELMTMTLEDYEKQKLYGATDVIDTISIEGSSYKTVNISPIEEVDIFIKKGELPEQDIVIYDDIKAPIKRGEVIGQMTLIYGENTKRVDITVTEDVSRFKMAVTVVANFIASIFQ